MHMPSMPQLLIILAIIILIFGGKRIAEVAKGLGKGVKNFKDAVTSEENSEEESERVEVIEEKPKRTRAAKAAPKATKTAAKPRAKKTTKEA
jgi:sec-independent protein translocase protein TatA